MESDQQTGQNVAKIDLSMVSQYVAHFDVMEKTPEDTDEKNPKRAK